MNENNKVKTPEQLFDLYLKSVGRGANFLLNIPPDRRGLIHENDSTSLVGFKRLLHKNLSTNILRNSTGRLISLNGSINTSKLTDSSVATSEQLSDYKNQGIRFRFKEPVEVNCISIQETIQYGQRIKSFEIILENNGDMKTIQGTTVGRKRIISFPSQKITGVGIRILDAKTTPIISDISLYRIEEKLVEH